jgi:hypothetical protein
MSKTPILYCDDGSEIELPFVWVICGACAGHGKSSGYLGAYTRDDLDEAGPDFREEYFGGGYDRTCEPCDGLGRVRVVCRKRTARDQLDDYDAQVQADREIDAIHAAERRMGA